MIYVDRDGDKYAATKFENMDVSEAAEQLAERWGWDLFSLRRINVGAHPVYGLHTRHRAHYRSPDGEDFEVDLLDCR